MISMATKVGSVELANPVMTAAGTAGFGTELSRYLDLSKLGAFVTKSLSFEPWDGNPYPRVSHSGSSMMNSVGLDNPGIEHWISQTLPRLRETGAVVVASIWGRSIRGFEQVASCLAGIEGISAVEVNISCPNVEERSEIFSHRSELAAAALGATAICGLPRWAKLSPNVTDLGEIVSAVTQAGAEAVTLVNTVMAMSIDTRTLAPSLGNGGGGLSGSALRPVAVRAIFETRRAFPELPILGVGGVASGAHAAELLMAGANAIQVGTASFANPRAAHHVQRGLKQWLRGNRMTSLEQLIGAAHADR